MSFERPVSLKPYFDEIQEHLNNQYLLTFGTSGGGRKGKFERVRVNHGSSPRAIPDAFRSLPAPVAVTRVGRYCDIRKRLVAVCHPGGIR